jgi:20S proteasome subunit beta 2
LIFFLNFTLIYVKNLIISACLKDGVVLGADTRATDGSIVAEKNCAKIHYISPNI